MVRAICDHKIIDKKTEEQGVDSKPFLHRLVIG